VFWRTSLSSAAEGNAIVRDVVWGGANLSYVDWAGVRILGDEYLAQRPTVPPELTGFGMTPLALVESAVRAYQQVAVALRAQGIHEWADHFAYRANVLQRRVLRGQRRYLRSCGSLLLDLISGYGYKPVRSFIAYLVVILGFAGVYFALGSGVVGLGVRDAVNTPLAALVFSVTSFHGRGFFPGGDFRLDDPLIVLAAAEAIMGLFIEITFIATFTQRFFAR
jgi:hypothetical protein